MSVKSGKGRIHLFNDCTRGVPAASCVAGTQFGDFKVSGLNFHSGPAIAAQNAANGICRFTSHTGDNDTTAIMTDRMFVAGTMGTMILEARLAIVTNLDDKALFIGFCDESADAVQQNSAVIDEAANDIDYETDNLVGFFFHDDLTDDDEWHYAWNGGSAAAVTDSEEMNTGISPTAGEFQILRLEVDRSGTARWFIDGVLLKTLKGAVSTSATLAAYVGISREGADAIFDADYVMVDANRSWAV